VAGVGLQWTAAGQLAPVDLAPDPVGEAHGARPQRGHEPITSAVRRTYGWNYVDDLELEPCVCSLDDHALLNVVKPVHAFARAPGCPICARARAARGSALTTRAGSGSARGARGRGDKVDEVECPHRSIQNY
jgi:hypothetical protein